MRDVILITTRAPVPEEVTRDLVARGMTVRAASVDEKTRSVEVTMTTEGQVTVMDLQRYEPIDEVLLADGGQFPDQLPLLANHARYSLDAVLGSVRDMHREGSKWVGRAYFAEGDPEAEKAWNKVKQGHLRDVSAGYRATDYEDIPPNQKRVVNGREYTAGDRTLRISKRWDPKELSLVPIGADRNTKVRHAPGAPGTKENAMPPQVRKYLESIGLRTDASDVQAQEFLNKLQGKQRHRADALAGNTATLEETFRAEVVELIAAAAAAKPGDPSAPTGQRGDTSTSTTTATPGTAATTTVTSATPTPDQIRADAQRGERERVKQIRELATPEVPTDLVSRAEEEGWTTERAAGEFLRHLRGGRSPSVGASAGGATAPGGIVANHERDCTQRTLGLAMAMRANVDLERWAKRQRIPQAEWQNLAQRADRYNDMSMVDVCREALRLDGREIPATRDETIRAAVSGAALTQIFTTSVNAMLLQAYEEEPDTTMWVEETDVADFKTNLAIKYAGNAGMKKLGRGGKADHATAEDSAESYKVARYAKQFVVDEQDIIDDSFNALSDMPREFGQASRRLRPDLVYAMMLANPTMADGGAVMNTTALTTAGGHANFANDASNANVGGPLAAASLQNAIVQMAKQFRGSGRNKVVLNIKPQYLIVPPELKFTAEILLTSAERIISTSDGGTFNPLKGTLTPVVEARLGTVGVTDPDSGTAYTGTAVNYWLASRPGLHARVAYRRGTNRSPMIRSFNLDKGQWGIGWDVNLDIGCKFVDFRGIFGAKGAA
jgi:hypothetical protein